VAFLAPKVTSELLALQERVFGAFRGVAQGLWPHYEPAQWMPHCTLSIGLGPEHLEAAWEACRQFGLPRNCLVTEIGLVEFRPVRHLHTAALGA
jgi:hypothetical protein